MVVTYEPYFDKIQSSLRLFTCYYTCSVLSIKKPVVSALRHWSKCSGCHNLRDSSFTLNKTLSEDFGWKARLIWNFKFTEVQYLIYLHAYVYTKHEMEVFNAYFTTFLESSPCVDFALNIMWNIAVLGSNWTDPWNITNLRGSPLHGCPGSDVSGQGIHFSSKLLVLFQTLKRNHSLSMQ